MNSLCNCFVVLTQNLCSDVPSVGGDTIMTAADCPHPIKEGEWEGGILIKACPRFETEQVRERYVKLDYKLYTKCETE